MSNLVEVIGYETHTEDEITLYLQPDQIESIENTKYSPRWTFDPFSKITMKSGAIHWVRTKDVSELLGGG